MSKYILRPKARDDIRQLYKWGFDQFGEIQADKYLSGLLDQLDIIAKNLLNYVSVGHLSSGTRRCVYKSHSIYYDLIIDGIAVVRVLGQQNPVTAFDE